MCFSFITFRGTSWPRSMTFLLTSICIRLHTGYLQCLHIYISQQYAQYYETVPDMHSIIFKLCHKLLIITSSSQMRSCLYPKWNWTALLSYWGFRVVGHCPAASQSVYACSGQTSSPVRAVAESPHRQASEGFLWEDQIQAGQLFYPVSSGLSPALAWMGGIRGWRAKELRNKCFRVLRPGYWLTFLCKAPPLFFCLFSFSLPPLNPALRHAAAASGSTLGRCLYSFPSTLLLHWEWN